jgi:tetratricopeptide (TPR) repeat protein
MSWLGETELAWQWALARKADAGPDDLQVIYDESILRLLEGDAEFGIRLFSSADERGVFTPGQPHLGHAFVLLGGDPARAVADFERALTVAGNERPTFNRYDWENHLHYAIAMHRNGETERASAWFEKTEKILRAQIAQGVVHGRLQRRLHEALASIHATRGEHGKAIASLRQAVALSGLSSKFIDSNSVYAPLRDLPAFRQVLTDARRRNELARDALAAEGLLLTPEALLALPEFDHDPFAR